MNLGGDCVWDETRGLFWTGYGLRSDRAASVVVEDLYGVETIPLELADSRTERLRATLVGRGYQVVTVPLGSFLRSGTSAFCLTLRLDRSRDSSGYAGRDDASAAYTPDAA